MKSIALAALLSAPVLSQPQAGAQVYSPIDCSYTVTATGLRNCLELQELANRGNRNYCLSRISTARRQAAAGVRNAWLQVPTECLY